MLGQGSHGSVQCWVRLGRVRAQLGQGSHGSVQCWVRLGRVRVRSGMLFTGVVTHDAKTETQEKLVGWLVA